VASGGLSYIPSVTVEAGVDIGLVVGGIPGLPSLPLPDLGVSAAATVPGGFGGNLGAGIRIPVSSGVALLFEARAFGFPKKEIQWGTGSGQTSPIEEALAAALDPIEFQYGFFQATGGVVFTF
jgi:hypothetical protein